MIKCVVCGGRHTKGSGPYQWHHNPANPDYIRIVVIRHNQGAHQLERHKHCPICIGGTQLSLEEVR